MSAPVAGAITYSPEQNSIYEVRTGTLIVAANAGSGKTEVTAEHFVRQVESEVKKRCGERPPTEDEMKKVLLQFTLITFTKKASAELNDRAIRKLQGRGLPIPQDFGKPMRLCRTLDSYLQMWLKTDAFFGFWMYRDERWRSTLSDSISLLSEQAKTAVAKQTSRSMAPADAQRLAFFRFRRGLLTEGPQALLIDFITCQEFDYPVPFACTLDGLLAAYTNYLKQLDPAKPETVSVDFLAPFVESHVQWGVAHAALKTKAIMSPADEVTLKQWNVIVAARSEFIGTHELARGRYYHPENYPQALKLESLLSSLAGLEHIDSASRFHSMASAYLVLKRKFCMLDFGDYLTVFQSVMNKKDFLLPKALDPEEEYPSSRIRRKYTYWDEVQDNSPLQFGVFRMMRAIGKDYFTLAVGDPYQSLYAFRGAYPQQFIEYIEAARKEQAPVDVSTGCKPDTLRCLTNSFRSAKKIVDFGNHVLSIVTTKRKKGETKKRVTPGSKATIKNVKGEIIVCGPLRNRMQEAYWIMERVRVIAAEGLGSIMIIGRNNPLSHPVCQMLRTESIANVSIMTIHAAKGLEADNVFLVDMVAGVFPSMRSSMNQEGNALYVAVTRPRRRLYISGYSYSEEIDEDGLAFTDLVGPSPYFGMIPQLETMALNMGWTENDLKRGQDTHRKGSMGFMTNINKRKHLLRDEVEALFPTPVDSEAGKAPIPVGSEALNYTEYLGAISPLEHIPVEHELPSLGVRHEQKQAPIKDDEKKRLLTNLRKAFFASARPSALTGREIYIAVESGWIDTSKGIPVFTQTFREHIQTGQKRVIA